MTAQSVRLTVLF